MKVEDFQDWMRGEDCIVVGAGPSAKEFRLYDHYWTLTCNRSIRYASSDFAVCYESPRDPMWDVIRETAPLFVFTHTPIKHVTYPRAVQSPSNVLTLLGETYEGRVKVALDQSPHCAIGLALHMGFRRIGVIGVDLTDTDRYPVMAEIEKEYRILVELAERRDQRVLQLNHKSRLQAIPHGWLEDLQRKVHA